MTIYASSLYVFFFFSNSKNYIFRQKDTLNFQNLPIFTPPYKFSRRKLHKIEKTTLAEEKMSILDRIGFNYLLDTHDTIIKSLEFGAYSSFKKKNSCLTID